jgi:crotonobetainyl-CoA:carnitine CoA-transferase CaiB-like acyl-CoA transferase
VSEGPLAGVRVLDLTRLLPGGYATLLMADMGADVVKVEEPGKGDYIRWTPPLVGEFSSGHIALNRNKRSVSLNLKTDEGKELLLRLVDRFDVLIESFRPGVMDRLGLGWSTLRETNPSLVYCAITGYGQDGPRAQEAGHDVNYAAYAGMLSIVGEEDGRPVIPGVQVGDLAGGGMASVIAILAALHRRHETGRGDFCDIAMSDGIVSWLSIHASEFFASGEVPHREQMHLSGRYPCYRIYPASDGWLSVGALEPQFWAALCETIDRPDLAGDAFALGDRRDEVIGELTTVFAAKTRAQWMESFRGRDVCVAPVNNFEEAFADDQLAHREMAVEVDLPDGSSIRQVGNPLKFAASTSARRMPPPRLGEHTNEVLAEIDVNADQLDALRTQGVV